MTSIALREIMVEEVIAPVAAPVVDNATPVADSTGAATITPEIAQTPVQEVAPVTEAPKVEAAPVEKPVEKSLLGTEPEKPAQTKPVDEKKPATEAEKSTEVKTDESKQSDEPAPLPTYEQFTLPENVKLDDVKLGEFTKELGEFETSLGKLKPEEMHKSMQDFGQKLLNRYITETQETFARLQEYQQTQWEKTKNDWKESFIKDPDIGGNRQQTTLNTALEFIRTHGGNEDQQKEFHSLMDTTGVGNHPAMIRMMSNAMQTFREGKPLPAQKPAPTNTSKVQRRYGNNN